MSDGARGVIMERCQATQSFEPQVRFISYATAGCPPRSLASVGLCDSEALKLAGLSLGDVR